MAANYTGKFFYPVALEFFLQKLRGISASGLKFKYEGETELPNGAEVKLSKDITMASWGEDIKVTLTAYTNGTHVQIYSECTFPIQEIDWGVNQGNVATLFRYFEHRMPIKK